MGELEADNSGPNCKVDVDAALTNEHIADAVLNENITEHSAANSLGLSVQKTLGLLDENSYSDQEIYNSDGYLTSARKRTYIVNSSVGTNNDVLATYLITTTWNGDEMTSYKMVKL